MIISKTQLCVIVGIGTNYYDTKKVYLRLNVVWKNIISYFPCPIKIFFIKLGFTFL